MSKLIAIALVAAFAAFSSAVAACPPASPDAVISKAPKDARTNPKTASDAKGIAEDGQHTPMETDPNAPGVTKSEGGTTTNIAQAETEIAAAGSKEGGANSGTTGTTAASSDTACQQ
jgi:hypothetical protein